MSVAVVEDLRFVLALCSSDVFVTVRESSLVSEKRFVLSVLVFGASACRWVNSSSYRTRCGEESVSSCFLSNVCSFLIEVVGFEFAILMPTAPETPPSPSRLTPTSEK